MAAAAPASAAESLFSSSAVHRQRAVSFLQCLSLSLDSSRRPPLFYPSLLQPRLTVDSEDAVAFLQCIRLRSPHCIQPDYHLQALRRFYSSKLQQRQLAESAPAETEPLQQGEQAAVTAQAAACPAAPSLASGLLPLSPHPSAGLRSLSLPRPFALPLAEQAAEAQSEGLQRDGAASSLPAPLLTASSLQPKEQAEEEEGKQEAAAADSALLLAAASSSSSHSAAPAPASAAASAPAAAQHRLVIGPPPRGMSAEGWEKEAVRGDGSGGAAATWLRPLTEAAVLSVLSCCTACWALGWCSAQAGSARLRVSRLWVAVQRSRSAPPLCLPAVCCLRCRSQLPPSPLPVRCPSSPPCCLSLRASIAAKMTGRAGLQLSQPEAAHPLPCPRLPTVVAQPAGCRTCRRR